MFDTLKRLYDEKKINEAGLNKAVTMKWITEEQKKEIMSN